MHGLIQRRAFRTLVLSLLGVDIKEWKRVSNAYRHGVNSSESNVTAAHSHVLHGFKECLRNGNCRRSRDVSVFRVFTRKNKRMETKDQASRQ